MKTEWMNSKAFAASLALNDLGWPLASNPGISSMLPRWTSEQIVAFRPEGPRPQPGVHPLTVICEQEAADSKGTEAEVLTVFLRGSECRFRCLMCDLWKHTHVAPTGEGAIVQQIRNALAQSERNAKWIKLYNASNFFAPVNVPTADLPQIAEEVSRFERVIVENHPRILTEAIPDFRERLDGRLEVAMGLETIHAETLKTLNKQMTVDDFRRACEWLQTREIDTRAFILLRPPGMTAEAGVEWCVRSAELARRLGVRHISIIPLRGGNGALEILAAQGNFSPPDARDLAKVMEQLWQWSDVVVTADLWDWERLPCPVELRQPLRLQLEAGNRTQRWLGH